MKSQFTVKIDDKDVDVYLSSTQIQGGKITMIFTTNDDDAFENNYKVFISDLFQSLGMEAWTKKEVLEQMEKYNPIAATHVNYEVLFNPLLRKHEIHVHIPLLNNSIEVRCTTI